MFALTSPSPTYHPSVVTLRSWFCRIICVKQQIQAGDSSPAPWKHRPGSQACSSGTCSAEGAKNGARNQEHFNEIPLCPFWIQWMANDSFEDYGPIVLGRNGLVFGQCCWTGSTAVLRICHVQSNSINEWLKQETETNQDGPEGWSEIPHEAHAWSSPRSKLRFTVNYLIKGMWGFKCIWTTK